MSKRNTNRTAKVKAASRKAAFTTPKAASPEAVITDGQFRILAIARQIKQIATQYDEYGDALWRLADEAAQIIELRK